MSTKEALTNSIQTIEISSRPKRSKMRSALKANEQTTRAPALDITVGSEVVVVNGDRSNLTWKRYTLIEKNSARGMCIVQGIADSRQRNFPRSVVKPKDYIDKLRNIFRAMSSISYDEKDSDEEKEKESHNLRNSNVEFHDFFNAMQLMGAEYDHDNAVKIFKALDVGANGILTFSQFINWVYGLGRTTDKGRLLTTIECICGLRKWNNNLTYYVMGTIDNDDLEGNSSKKCIWSIGKYDRENSTVDLAHLVTINNETNEINETNDNNNNNNNNNNDEININIFEIPKNIRSFRKEFSNKIIHGKTNKLLEVYTPSNEDERVCNVVVMGPGEIGKSALINKFVKGVFPHDYDPTIQDQLRKQILVDEEPALLDILDTAGQEEFASMRYDWLRDSIDILLICFSRYDHQSFIRAGELIGIAKRLLRQQSPPRIVPILLVATKKDLCDQQAIIQVTLDDISDLREEYLGPDFIGYEECSAFMDENVLLIFESAVRMYRKWKSSEQSGIKIRYPTIREQQMRQRQGTYAQQMQIQSRLGKTKFLSYLSHFCPAMAAYMQSDELRSSSFNSVASVAKDKFGDELAEPSYSKQHFFVQRELSCSRLLYCIIAAVFFPIVITWQTLYFIFYCNATNCFFKCLSSKRDFTDPQIQLLYDFFGPIVGRDPRDSAFEHHNDAGGRKYFLSQTYTQKLSRIIFMLLIDVLFFFAWYNAITVGFGWFGENSDKGAELSVLETLGPQQLWLLMWLILAIYMSLDIEVKPKPPSMQSLRPYVMYLNTDESIRTTAYVFLRAFSKSTLAIFRIEATGERIITAFVVSIIWILIPGVVRIVFKADGGGLYFPIGLKLEAITSMFISFIFVFLLVLGSQMQLMSGLVKYIDWMNNITSMLDKVFSDDKGLHYINLVRHNNTLAWIEMRTYLYTKGLIIFSRQEIFVFYVIFVQTVSAMYILWRLMSGTGVDNTYGSPSFVGILIVFLAVTYSLLRILRTTRRIERLQGKQIALLAAQKFQIYYKRITYHPSKDEQDDMSNNELSEGNYNDQYDQDWADIDPKNLPPMDDEVIDDESDTDSENIDDDVDIKENQALLHTSDNHSAAQIDIDKNLGRAPTKLRLQRTTTNKYAKISINRQNHNDNQGRFSAEYLDQSEKFVQAVINICEAQDIIPRVFNIKIQTAVGLSILCTSFAVIPTAARLAFGSDCAAWSD